MQSLTDRQNRYINSSIGIAFLQLTYVHLTPHLEPVKELFLNGIMIRKPNSAKDLVMVDVMET